MRLCIVVILLGIGILIAGIVFHLQGQGIVGPPESFMYTNPDWINYGTQIAIAGAVIIGVGLVLIKRYNP